MQTDIFLSFSTDWFTSRQDIFMSCSIDLTPRKCSLIVTLLQSESYICYNMIYPSASVSLFSSAANLHSTREQYILVDMMLQGFLKRHFIYLPTNAHEVQVSQVHQKAYHLLLNNGHTHWKYYQQETLSAMCHKYCTVKVSMFVAYFFFFFHFFFNYKLTGRQWL